MPDVYQMVTDRIIALMEQGKIPWERPWTGAGRYAIKRVSGEPYSLLNQMLLGDPGEYLSFNECKREGGKIKKGSKARIVVFWKMLEKNEEKDGEIKVRQIPFLRYSQVFHISDCEGLKPRHYEETLRDFEPISKAEDVIESYVTRSGVKLEHANKGRAYYSPSEDKVVLPLKEQFTGEAEYYSTAFHELTHSTGHKNRLDRLTEEAAFGDKNYSKEELIAEIGSASIMNWLGIETDGSFRNSTAYIQGWLKTLRNDKKLIVSAASKAGKAAEMIVPEMAAI